MRITLPNNFTPRPYQKKFMRYLDRGGKRAVWVVHRRGGKDLTAMHQTCKMMHQRRAAYWHVFPTATRARSAIWEGYTKDGQRIMEQVFPSEIRKSPRDFRPNSEMIVELKCGSVWRLFGSDKIEVVGAGPAGIIFSEFAVAKPSAWDFARPMLRENDGWAAFISTPRGKNHLWHMYEIAGRQKGWWRDLQTLFDTRAYDPEATIAAERAEGMPDNLIRQEYLCDWTAANVGSIYGDLMEALERRGGLSHFDHPLDGVFTSWDLGISDSTAIWFWRVLDDGIEFIDRYEAHGKPLSHYFELIDTWSAQKGYRYTKHWLPHDARQRSLQTGVSILDQFITRYTKSQVEIGPSLDIPNGIQATRWMLEQPGTRFHGRCSILHHPGDIDGVDAIREYHHEWDDAKKVFSDEPEHDWTSHAADALRYAACVAKVSNLIRRAKVIPPPKPIARSLQSFTMDEMWEYGRTGKAGWRA